MKKTAILCFMLCFIVSIGHGQFAYYPGERKVKPYDIPGLTEQLKNTRALHIRADLMLSISFGYLLKPGEEQADLDSAMAYAQKAAAAGKNPVIINESLLLTAMIQLEKRDVTLAKATLHKVNDSTKQKLLLCISRYYYFQGNKVHKDGSHMDSSIRYGRPSLLLAVKLKHPAAISALLEWLEFMASQATSYDEEEQYSFILRYCDSVKFPSKVYVLSMRCNDASVKGDFYKALNYAIKAEKALNRNSSIKDRHEVNANLGNIHMYMKNYEKSIYYYENILNNASIYRTAGEDIYSLANVYCFCLMQLKRSHEIIPYLQAFKQKYPPQNNHDKKYYHSNMASTYKDLKMFAPAEEHFLEAIKYGTSGKISIASLYSYLGTLYYEFKYYEKAIIALKTAEKEIVRENQVFVASTLRQISLTEAALGNYENAYKYLVKSKGITDSIYDVSKAKHTRELEVQYQTQKKEADLRLKEENIRYLNQHAELMTRDAKLQKAQLVEASLLAGQKEITLQLKEKNIEALTNSARQQKAEIAQSEAMREITVLVIVLLAVIIALLIWLFWSKLRSNKIITDKNTQLQQLVTDKSWLVKEMHHRVKNNLHTVMSLLESQSSYLQDDALEAVKNSQCRIFSMSLIHQKLYQEDAVKTIDMGCYIPELISYLRECFNLPGSYRIHMDIDPAEFDVSDAVPLGLIVNEAVTNSLKYAHAGEIHISLKATGPHEYELILADNGIGLQEAFDINNVTSLGFKLIKGLSDQLDAKLSILNENGLKIRLSNISLYKAKQLTA